MDDDSNTKKDMCTRTKHCPMCLTIRPSVFPAFTQAAHLTLKCTSCRMDLLTSSEQLVQAPLKIETFDVRRDL